MVKLSTIHIFFSIAASQGLEIQQLDVVTAYLNGEITEEIHMDFLEGYLTPHQVEFHNRAVCKLQMGLYGLKQMFFTS